ncbi:MAG: hypothetical protein ACPMAQ_03905 [Phycisphaerae bacterium]
MAFRRIIIGPPGGFLWQVEMLAGIVLVVAGILIAVFPEILVALISGLIVLGGLSLIGAGLRTRSLLRYRAADEYEVIDS